jgi:hypothetical protein
MLEVYYYDRGYDVIFWSVYFDGSFYDILCWFTTHGKCGTAEWAMGKPWRIPADEVLTLFNPNTWKKL